MPESFFPKQINRPPNPERQDVPLQRPISISDALEFANEEFEKKTRFWPRRLVTFSEQKENGGAFRFALQTYDDMAERIGNDYVSELIRELRGLFMSNDSSDCTKILERSREIWEYSGDRSFFKRGTTRLFNALSYRLEKRRDDYEVELTRALGMAILDDTENSNEEYFNVVINLFKKTHK